MRFLIGILAVTSGSLLPHSALAESECTAAFPLVPIDPLQPLVEARIVFIAFPEDGANQPLPTWAEELESELPPFIETMSGGIQEMNLTITRRPSPDDSIAWLADNPLSHYNTGGPPGMGHLTAEVMTEIHDTYPGSPDYWQGVDQVFVVYYRCIGLSGFGSTCTNSGISSLGIPASVTVPSFAARNLSTKMRHS